MKFHFVSKRQTSVSDLHTWLLSDKLAFWCVIFFFFFAKLTLQHRFKESKAIGRLRWHCFGQTQNTKPLLSQVTTHFSTLYHFPKIPKPNMLSHEPSLQLHRWGFQIESKMATVSFSSLSLRLVSLFYPTNG